MSRPVVSSTRRPPPLPRAPGPRRSDDLVDGIMGIIAARGFANVPVAEMARELSCSLTTLYRVAPSKDSLVVVAISRWGELTLQEAEARAAEAGTAWERVHAYFRAGVESLLQQSHAFRRDLQRFDSTRVAYQAVSDRYVDRLGALIEEAVGVGDLRPVNARLLAGLLRHLAAAVRDEDLLEVAGATAGEALSEIESILLDGLRSPSGTTHPPLADG